MTSDPNSERGARRDGLAIPSSRLSRFGRLSGMTASIAGNMAVNGLAQMTKGQRPTMRNLLLTPGNITRVADQLAQMRGAAMKIGQLMSMDAGEVLPPELAQIMARLRDDAHFMPPSQLKQLLNAQWPDKWLRSFQRFDVRPIAAASIGQVHRAQLKDGRDLAIKIQYPGIARSIDSDVANVGALIRMSGLVPKGLDLRPYLEEARVQLHEETDYDREAREMTRFRALLSGDDAFAVPEVQPDWSTSQILAMTFADGTAIENAQSEPQQLRNDIATKLIRLTLKELFDFGAMQTDPNFANYLSDPATGRIVLLDFGAARDLNANVVGQYRRLIQAGLTRDRNAIEHASEEIGFLAAGTKPAHRALIIDMIDLVFDALTKAKTFDFVAEDLSPRMQAMGEQLALDGFVPPPLPIDVLLVQRKFGGMFLLAKRLQAKVDVMDLLGEALA